MGEGEGGKIWENGIETCIISYMKWITRIMHQTWTGDSFHIWHWNMYNIIYEMNHQSRFDAWYRMLGAGALGWPRGMVWGGRREEGSGWGTHVYLWRIHFDIWQNKYNYVKFKNKIKLEKKKINDAVENRGLLILSSGVWLGLSGGSLEKSFFIFEI